MTSKKLEEILTRMEPDIEDYRRWTEAEKLHGPGYGKYCELHKHAGERDVRIELKPFKKAYLKYRAAHIEYCAGAMRYQELLKSAELKEAIKSAKWEGLRNFEAVMAKNIQAWHPRELRKYGEFTGWSSWPQWIDTGVRMAIPPAIVAGLLWLSWWFLLISWLVLRVGYAELFDNICAPTYRLGGRRAKLEAEWVTTLRLVGRDVGIYYSYLTPPILNLLYERYQEIKESGDEQDRLEFERSSRYQANLRSYAPGSSYRGGDSGGYRRSDDDLDYGHQRHGTQPDAPVYPSVNPASGLPMMDHTPFDVSGHVFGTND